MSFASEFAALRKKREEEEKKKLGAGTVTSSGKTSGKQASSFAEQFVGKALVIDCRDVGEGGEIGMEYIDRALADEADFLLFNTGWDENWGRDKYFGEYPVVSMEVCQYLLDSKKKGVGFDVIGIDPVSDINLTRHKMLLSQRDIVIIENLTNLDKIGGGLFTFAALPLKYKDADGAPIRAVAIIEE